MNGPNDEHDDEAAARAIQENLWLAEHEEEHGAPNAEDERLRLLLGQRLEQDFGDDDAQQEDDGDDDGADAADLDMLDGEAEAIDGGVAGDVKEEGGGKVTRSLKCPLILYFECDENLDELSADNPILKRGVTVYIGLDKNTKLEKVFTRYCEIANSKASSKSEHVKMEDFEFVHATILDKGNTVEQSAMMKNDRIKVRKERSKERAKMMDAIRIQRESDRKYFESLRHLLPNLQPEGAGCDLILDCKGKVVDERGYKQHVLATTVRANSVFLSKRCKWLKQKILIAREQEKANHAELEQLEAEAAASMSRRTLPSDGEDDIVPSFPQLVGRNNDVGGNHPRAAEVEDDDDEDDDAPAKARYSALSPPMIRVTLDHPPEAVKLLLEYCYTNRVLCLGQEAFTKASRHADAKDVGELAAKESGPVSPFKKHGWPNGGLPDVSLHVALAGIALAEEVHMPRLSLMCEIAASQLVDHKNVIDVLSACQMQQQKTGNRLPLLRKAAMLDCVMAEGSKGIERLYENLTFKSNLVEKCALVIPSLLEGTVEVLPTNMKTKEIQKKKEAMSADTQSFFAQQDECDEHIRAFERQKWRSAEVFDKESRAIRMKIAFGSEDITRKMPYHIRDPPTHKYGTSSKRKVRSGSGDGDWNRSAHSRRNVRRKTRKGP